jgi:glycosyltransferase involved in cell wall biosynthesis
MPKILILANKVPYPSKDGSSIAMARLLENFIEFENHDITYGALNTIKHRKQIDDFPNAIKKRITLKTFEVDTSPTPANALTNLLFTRQPFHTIRFFVFSMQKWLEEFEDSHFDLVVLEGAFMGHYLPLARLKGNKVVLRAHNLEHVIWERSSNNLASPLKKFYLNIQTGRLKKFEQNLAMLVHAVWSISSIDMYWFKTFNVNSFFVPVSIKRQEMNMHIVPKSCFFLGALDWMPNLESLQWFLREVWPLVNQLDPSIEFHVAGNKTPNKIKTLKSHNLHVHGKVPSAERFSKNHGVSIIPLLSGSGVRIKLLENGSFGIPTISTTIGAEGVYDIHDSKIPLSDIPQELAREIVALTTDSHKAAQIAQDLYTDMNTRFSAQNAMASILQAWPK